MSEVTKLALYFGCLGEAGHYVHSPRGWTTSLDPRNQYGTPWSIRHMDGGLLTNRKVPDQPDGRVHWTHGGRPHFWHAFFWWDRSADQRGASNSGFYVRGFAMHCESESFAYALEQWPQVVKRQLHQLVLVDLQGATK